jgi:HAD superfamily hydrolase (TIGR01490 family)
VSEKKFAVFDIDGTLIRWQLYHAINDALIQSGKFDEAVFAPVKAARMRWKRRKHEESYMEYERRLVETFNTLLTSLTRADFERAAETVIKEYKEQVYTYTRELMKDLKGQGYVLFAVSGSPNTLVKKIADYYGFDDFVGSAFEVKSGRFTGKQETPFGRKHIIIAELVKKYGLSIEGSVGVGDSEGDISMLEMVENPIAFNPSRKLLEAAKKNQWQIVIERKNVVYKLESKDGIYILA